MRALIVFLLLINYTLYGYSVPIFSGAKNIGGAYNLPIYSGVEIVVAADEYCDTARLDSVVFYPSQVKADTVYYNDTIFLYLDIL